MISNQQIQIIANTLSRGGVCILPTETVYGLVTAYGNQSGTDRIFQIKQRDSSRPLALIFASPAMALSFLQDNWGAWGTSSTEEMAEQEGQKTAWATQHSNTIAQLLQTGATVILPQAEGKKPSQGGAESNQKVIGSIGVRVPQHNLTRDVIELLGGPLYATSVNTSGQEPAKAFREIDPTIINAVDLAISLDDSVKGEPSTIIDFRSDQPAIIRHGSQPMDEISRILQTTLGADFNQDQSKPHKS